MSAAQMNGPLPNLDCQDLLAEWRLAVREQIDARQASNEAIPLDDRLDAAYRAARDRCRAVARKVWARPLTGLTYDGWTLRAEIVKHLLWTDYDGNGQPLFEMALAGEEADDHPLTPFDLRAVAELVNAVLRVHGPGPARARVGRDTENGNRSPFFKIEDDLILIDGVAGVLHLAFAHLGDRGQDGSALAQSLWLAATNIEGACARITAALSGEHAADPSGAVGNDAGKNAAAAAPARA